MMKVLVGDNNQATVICPKCGFEKKANVTDFKDTQKRLKAKCKCGETFHFTIEFRRQYRYDVGLPGEYIIQGKGEKGEIIIRDLSLSGIRFESFISHQISTDDTLEVTFKLDNPLRKEIRKIVNVIWVNNLIVGAQFSEIKSFAKDLGFYLNF